MKKTALLFSLFCLLLASSAVASTMVTYYTTAVRCQSCLLVEQYVDKAIRTSPYADRLNFRSVDITSAEHNHQIQRLGLVNKSVVIENHDTGEAYNLMEVWLHLGNEEKFIEYVQGAIAEFAEKGYM